MRTYLRRVWKCLRIEFTDRRYFKYWGKGLVSYFKDLGPFIIAFLDSGIGIMLWIILLPLKVVRPLWNIWQAIYLPIAYGSKIDQIKHPKP